MNAFQNNTKKDNYDNSNNETIPCAVAQPIEEYGGIPHQKMVFDRPKTFIIKNEWFGRGNAQITTTGSPCYKMIRTGGLSTLRNTKLIITDLSNQPLLKLKEYRYKSGVAIELQNPRGAPICRIYRQGFKLTIKNRYNIELLDQGLKSYKYPAGITCQGTNMLPIQFDLTDDNSGQTLATMKKNLQIVTVGGSKWHLDIPAGHDEDDAILFLGITCAIDRIHTEVKKRKGKSSHVGAY